MTKSVSDVLFVTYGDKNFHNSKMLLCNEAHHFGFRKFLVGSPENLPKEFIEKHKAFFDRSKRGAGYWLWKPFIVNEALKLINENDLLIYLDGGCSINQFGKERFHEWMVMTEENEILSFQMSHLPEKDWTKMNLVHKLDCQKEEILNSGQINATVFLLKKTPKVCKLISEWLEICSLEWTIDDSTSEIPNDIGFKDHRHDQSVFSLLRKKYNFFTIEDETYPSKTHDWSDPSVKHVPVLATRRKF